ncbi:hypothetical protein GCM10010995_28080 [Cysteiniphilum litorale]|uniref:Uncharacterized protein n=2 Tax=Fastidiosibacteraceae TaxID=2056687 RepID=A0A8J2Z6X9_9GAMM|nr:hypothetical protein GCM10010995_28080 [Cysteiniphilum litorale]
MLGFTIAYYANNRTSNRWFLDGECAPLTKISNLLGYSSVSQFKLGISQYGVALVLSKGLNKLRESSNG